MVDPDGGVASRSFRGSWGRRTGGVTPSRTNPSASIAWLKVVDGADQTYLDFGGTTEAAFAFYKAVFGTEFAGPIQRMGDLPAQPGQPELSAEKKNKVMSVKLPIAGAVSA